MMKNNAFVLKYIITKGRHNVAMSYEGTVLTDHPKYKSYRQVLCDIVL